jgi:hypothetical protein
MALQTSGAISLNDIHVEAGGSSGTNCTINDSDIRGLISKGSGATMSFNEWYGASAYTPASFVGSATLTFASLGAWSSSNRLNLTGAGVQNGDLVVIAMSWDNSMNSNLQITGISNLTLLYNGQTYGSPSYVVAYGYWQSGDSNPYSANTNTFQFFFNVVGAIFRNTNTSLLNSATASSSTGMPNPPSLASASGTKIIIATGHLDDDSVLMTAGAGYSLAGNVTWSSGFQRSSTAIQYKITSTSTTENPPAFGGGFSDASWASTLRF